MGIAIEPEEYRVPMILHQKISKELAKTEFNISNIEIFSAIECHTTLKQNYSQLDLVLFLADKIKWDQAGIPPYLEGLLKNLDKSLESAALYYIDYIVTHDILVIHSWLKAT